MISTVRTNGSDIGLLDAGLYPNTWYLQVIAKIYLFKSRFIKIYLFLLDNIQDKILKRKLTMKYFKFFVQYNLIIIPGTWFKSPDYLLLQIFQLSDNTTRKKFTQLRLILSMFSSSGIL
jgi:hypothetical protein